MSQEYIVSTKPFRVTVFKELKEWSGLRDLIAQEQQGLIEILEASQLPVKFNVGQKEDLEKVGVKFIGVSPGDDLFYDVVLPDGWRKVAVDGEILWCYLIDNKNNEVASIFYNGSLDNRKAFICLYF